MLIYLLNTITTLLQCILFLLGVYYFLISLFSFLPKKYTPAKSEKLRYAVIIPAHNEEQCLPHLLQSLEQQSYPQELFDIFVMADRCTDKTYQIASESHATPLLRKTDGVGKGAALEDAFSQISALPISYDAFVVFDADNIIDPRFLEEINHTIQQGNDAVQGYIDSKNPRESWLSNAYSIWYWFFNRTIQMGYDRLNFGCKLGGTGFALTKELLNEIPWKTSTMAEDAEYTLLLSLCDKKIAYAPKAVVFDEKPSSVSTSVKQRIRWTQGITQVQRDLCGRLIKNRKWTAFFRFWSDLFIPLCLVLFFVLNLFAIINLSGLAHFPFARLWSRPATFLILNLYLLGTLFLSVWGLILDKKWSVKIPCNIFGTLLYLITWIPAGLIGIFKHNHQEWYHTKHNANT